MPKPCFQIITLGCKVNQCESDGLSRSLIQAGWRPSESGGTVNLCVINTCTVTGKASMQARQAIRRAVREHPGARVVVTGCYAQTEPEAIRSIGGVGLVVGHSDKHRLAELIQGAAFEKEGDAPCVLRPMRRGEPFAGLPVAFGGRTRPFLKIQDGCDAFCTYCIVPHARGPSRSMPPESVLDHLRRLGEAGFREVVLSGIHLGKYGADLSPGTSLATLLGRIDRAGPVDRIRISSVESHELDGGIIDLVAASDRFCNHFHIPLQSGDDEILRRMGRPYTARQVGALVHSLRRRLPHAAVGLDLLIGFPGETDDAFENTRLLVADLPVTYLHVFPFSPRPRTPAAAFSGRVPDAVVRERCRRMRELGDLKTAGFHRSCVGRTLSVLVETGECEGAERVHRSTPSKGMSENYIPVRFSGGGAENTIVDVVIEEIGRENQVWGRRV